MSFTEPLTLEQRVHALESGQMRLSEMIVGILDATRSLNEAVFALGIWMQANGTPQPSRSH